MNRLKELLHEKIQNVQRAELEQRWSAKTIEKETEFLLLVKNLIEENETLKFEQTTAPPPPPEIELRDNLIRGLLIEVYGFRIAENAYLLLNDSLLTNLIEYRKLKINGTKALTKTIISDHLRQDIKTAPEFIKEHLSTILNQLENDQI